MANIQETTNYDRFELFDFNRDIGKTTALERSMLAYGWLDPYPMHVVKNGSGKLKIKAGHHRFHVARKLGIPCKYVVAEDQGETIQELEVATRPWTLQDYLASYCRVGSEHYIKVKNYLELTGIPIQCAIAMLAGQTTANGNQNNRFKAGTYKVSDEKHAYDVAFLAISCAEHGVRFARHFAFVQALSSVCRVDGFDKDIFISRVKAHSGMMTAQVSRDAYLVVIEQVYNYGGRKTRIPLAFLAKEAANRRNAVKNPKK
ncbi:MAG: hypothetical protein IPK79_14530 [Vampirovibrionales bacterium]|nr:hypothetical protein [Vampirovibrionales bacterium]MBK8191647.1 hypothetical protein [Vampirovibrionales bacterium]